MRRRSFSTLGQSGIALAEMMVATACSAVVVGALLTAFVGIRKSVFATNQYAVAVGNETRMTDYVARDLRLAVRVAIISGGNTTTLKTAGSVYGSYYNITDTTVLAINLPDYYASNSPNNSAGSNFKTTRYPRATLNTASTYNGNVNPVLNGIVPWAEAQTTVGGKRVTRFAPVSAGNGEIQVRYYRAPRSASDATPCFFRSEYAPGSSITTSTKEIVEKFADTASTTFFKVCAKNSGKVFKLQSSFSPRYRFAGETTAGSEEYVEVTCRNPRRD